MKRILCIISSLDAGGAETFLMKLYRTAAPDAYQFDFVVSKEDGYYTQEVLHRGGKIYFVPIRTKYLRKALYLIRKIVKDNGYDYVLKLTDSPLGVVDLLAAKAGGAKVLTVRSCNALSGRSFLGKVIDFFLRPILNCVANVKIAPSDLAAKYTFGEKQYLRGNVHLLNNGVDLSVFRYDAIARERIRQELSLENKLVIGHIGRFNQQKNHSFLLEVFAQIRKKRPDAVLLLVGKGELEQQIREQAESLGISDHIVFTGVRSDIPQLLSAMDVFVFPSFYEGMPNTVIEAQATGLPCVIADTITREADITGLVRYLPLSTHAESWAQTALDMVSETRKDTKQDFYDHGYDIESVTRRFVSLVFGELNDQNQQFFRQVNMVDHGLFYLFVLFVRDLCMGPLRIAGVIRCYFLYLSN